LFPFNSQATTAQSTDQLDIRRSRLPTDDDHELHGSGRGSTGVRRHQHIVAGVGGAQRGGSQEGDPQGQARRRHRRAARRLAGDQGLSPKPRAHLRRHCRRDAPCRLIS